ncbi:unnamed protein product, partial [Linum tenue]
GLPPQQIKLRLTVKLHRRRFPQGPTVSTPIMMPPSSNREEHRDQRGRGRGRR